MENLWKFFLYGNGKWKNFLFTDDNNKIHKLDKKKLYCHRFFRIHVHLIKRYKHYLNSNYIFFHISHWKEFSHKLIWVFRFIKADEFLTYSNFLGRKVQVGFVVTLQSLQEGKVFLKFQHSLNYDLCSVLKFRKFSSWLCHDT